MGLYITKDQLKLSSGLKIAEINKDIKNGTLNMETIEGEQVIYFINAINYVNKKWENNKVDMYPIKDCEPPLMGYGERLLNILDDGLTPIQLKKIARLNKKGQLI